MVRDNTCHQSILIVDDNPANIGMIINFLKDAEFHILVARDGASALEIAKYANPDLILLDILMPGMNGFEVCEKLKLDSSTREIPVIFVTALSETADTMNGFKVGGVDYIIKPFKCEEVLARIQTHLSLSMMKKLLKEQNDKLEKEVFERTLAEEALQKANRQINLLSSITRHDILNKVSVLLVYLEALDMNRKDSEPYEIYRKMLTIIKEIQNQIEFTRVYEDLGTHESQWHNLHETMPRSNLTEKIHFRTDLQNIVIFADPMLKKVFFNLLDNSVKHGQHMTEIHVSAFQSGEDLTVVWEDNGVGIAIDEKEKIFERGFGENSGLGMFLAREILFLTGISIRETGVPGKGARFEIKVPKGVYRAA
jgi:DNA-binding response OmpR family regulator